VHWLGGEYGGTKDGVPRAALFQGEGAGTSGAKARRVGIKRAGVEEFSSGVLRRRKFRVGKVNGVSHLEKGENGEVFADRWRLSGTNSAGGGIMTTDPVCGMRIDEKKTPEFHTQFAGRKYFFCSEECRKEFEADPNGYVETAAA
jgi:YHS domain-containing protein